MGKGKNGDAVTVPDFVVIVGCGLDKVSVPLGPVTHAVVEAARRLGHVDADHQPHFLLLTGSVGEARAVRRHLKDHGVTSEERIRAEGHPAPTLEDRAEALWNLLPHNGIPRDEHPLVVIVAPEPIVRVVELVFRSYAERRRQSRLKVFRFEFRGVAVPYSKSAYRWLFRGERRLKFWQWWAGSYHRLWEWGFGFIAPRPRLS